MTKQWEPGEVIARREIWHGRVWSGLPMYVVVDRSDLLALYLPSGSPLGFGTGSWPMPNGKHPWDRGPDSKWQGHGVLHLHRPGDPYAVWVFWQGPERRFLGWYLNLQAPFVRTEVGIDTLDHELDIVVDVDGSWRFKDSELMDSCIEYGRFSPAEVNQIQAEGARLGRMLDEDGQQWWDSGWSAWTPSPEFARPASLPVRWSAAVPGTS